MCGIVGYVGAKSAAAEIFCGLTTLEYRGYDSAGISVLNGGKISTAKHSGRVENLRPDVKNLTGGAGIGHTRWATHGAPTDVNAHPHTAGKFSVVHNGIIENYADLKAELQAKGVKFTSCTDSEVIVRLLDFYYNGDLIAALNKTVKRLKGSYALGVLCTDFDGVCAVKYKSPAIIGYGKGENYLASDITALAQKTKQITVLQDGDIALISAESVKIYGAQGKIVAREKTEIDVGAEDLKLSGCPHYMIKEIGEDARSVKDTAEAFFRLPTLPRLKEMLVEARRIIIVGCGTAYNSGLVAKKWFESNLSAFCTVEIASELRYNPPKITDKTLVIAVSQSGETADTIESAALLKSMGASVAAVTNVGFSALTRIADVVVPVKAGSEICVAATKSYLGQLACLYLMSKLCERDRVGELFSIAEKIEKVVADNPPADEIARLCADSSAVFFLGRGIDYDVAVEGSLKLKEVSYIFSDAYPAGELKHGTLALVDEKTLSIVLICSQHIAEKCENAVEQIVSRKGRVAVITNVAGVSERLKDKCETLWEIPPVSAENSPFLTSACLQLIAYKTAVLLGKNPDKPRNLAKSVTVE